MPNLITAFDGSNTFTLIRYKSFRRDYTHELLVWHWISTDGTVIGTPPFDSREEAERKVLEMGFVITEEGECGEEIGWILTEDQLPQMNKRIEYSEDGKRVEGTLIYIENRTCMLAGIAGGHGYFGEGFATDGEDGMDYGLICDPPKYWRYCK